MSTQTKRHGRNKGLIENSFLSVSKSSPAIKLFRVAVGILGSVYFADQIIEIELFVGEHALIHSNDIRLNFDHPRPLISEMIDVEQHSLYGLWFTGLLGSFAIAFGFFPRAWALASFCIAVVTGAWTYPLTYVDDSVVALALFWVAILPENIRQRSAVELHIRELSIRVVLLHIGVLYFLSGVWKLCSPMWRQGEALLVILTMPGSRFASFWQANSWTFSWSLLSMVNYLVIVIEIALPFLLLSASRKRRIVGVGMQWSMHISIASLMYVPFANLALAVTSLLFLHDDLNQWTSRSVNLRDQKDRLRTRIRTLMYMQRSKMFGHWKIEQQSGDDKSVPRRDSLVWGGYRSFLVTYILLVFSAGLAELPGLRSIGIHSFSQTVLNAVGLNHGFRLFDWIDSRAYQPVWQLSWGDRHGNEHPVELRELMPRSMRSAIYSTYFVGQSWIVPRSGRDTEWRSQLARNFNRRFCLRFDEADWISGKVQAFRIGAAGVLKADDSYVVANRRRCPVQR